MNSATMVLPRSRSDRKHPLTGRCRHSAFVMGRASTLAPRLKPFPSSFLRHSLTVAFSLTLLLSGGSGLSAQEAAALRLPPGIKLNRMPEQDADALVAGGLKNYPGLRQLDAQQLQRQSVSVGENQLMALSEVAEGILASHRKLEAGFARASRALLGGKTEATVDLVETDETFILVRSTKAVVLDPKAAGDASPEFKDYLQNGMQENKAAMTALTPESQQGMAAFIKNELRTLPAADPIRTAYEQGGEQALLEAIGQGKGALEITDTFIIPKARLAMANGQLRIPALKNGVFSFKQGVPATLPALTERNMPALSKLSREHLVKGEEIVAQRIPGTEPERAAPEGRRPATSTQGGEERFTAEFLTGFTEGNSWQWERRWTFPSGSFRITLGAGYGIGLRVPIVVNGRFGPTELDFKNHFPDRDRNVGMALNVDTLDANADFYRRVGLAPGKVFSGQETVLQLKAYYGLKFRALWSTIVHIPTREIGVDFGGNFKPPFGNSDSGYRLVIPARMTGTELDLGVVRGKAETALYFSGKGTIGLQHAPVREGLALRAASLSFTSPQRQTVAYTLPAVPPNVAGVQEQKYGFRLTKPSYALNLTVTPQVSVGIRVGYSWVSRSFNTGWIPLNALKVNLGQIRLHEHEGTTGFYEYTGGRKTFEQISFAAGVVPGAPTDPKAGIVSTGAKVRPNFVGIGSKERPALPAKGAFAFRSAQNQKIVRAGLGQDSQLGAVSPGKGAWESFSVVKLGGDRVALRSLQSNKLVKVVSTQQNLLAAVSDQLGDWETFEMRELGGNKFALRSVRTGKYVRAGVGAESKLAALSDRIDAWEIFLKE